MLKLCALSQKVCWGGGGGEGSSSDELFFSFLVDEGRGNLIASRGVHTSNPKKSKSTAKIKSKPSLSY